MIAAHILQQSPTDAVDFVMKNLFTNLRVARLKQNAGKLLKGMCLQLDSSGNSETFWAVWQKYRDITQYIGFRLNDDVFWEEQRISKECASKSFSNLLSSVFLNGMYWTVGQEWTPLNGEEERFTEAFSIFGIFAFHRFIEFLGTVGGGLLPSSWVPLSDCLKSFQKLSFSSNFLDSKSTQILLRLLQNEIVRRRIPHDDVPSWAAIRHLLDYLVDGGSPNAYRLRDSLPRTCQAGAPSAIS